VQRVPVRVALDPKEIVEHPLRVGLSMDAEIDVTKQDGKALADSARPAAMAKTEVFNSLDKGAEAEVQRVIVANLGRGVPSNVAKTTSRATAIPVAKASSSTQAH